MRKEFTPDYILENKGCYEQHQVEALSFIKKGIISIDDIIDSEILLKDKYWWVIKKCDLTIRQKQDLAISCAEIVLVIYEKNYPETKAPREAIEAVKSYLDGKTTIDELREKRTAATAAYAAAAAYDASSAYDAAYYAAYAAAAAAATYDAAYAAAYASAASAAAATYDAAYDAYDAAYDAYDAYDAATFNQLLFNNLKQFIKSNP